MSNQESNPENYPKEDPEVFALKKDKQGWQFSRRDFLRTAAVATAGLAAGCSPGSGLFAGKPTPTATKTPTPLPTGTPTPEPTGTSTPEPTETPTPDPTAEQIKQSCQAVLAHEGAVGMIWISPDGSTMISSGAENTVKLWSLPDGQLLDGLSLDGRIVSMALHPDGYDLAIVVEPASGHRAVQFFSLPDLFNDRTLELESQINQVAYSPDGKYLAAACADYTVRVWALPELALIHTLEGHNDSANCVVFCPDGSQLVSAGEDHAIRLWSAAGGELVQETVADSFGIDTLAISPDGTLLATHSRNSSIRVWSFPETEMLAEFTGDYGMAFSPDSSFLAFSEPVQGIYLWSPKAGGPVITMDDQQTRLSSLAISPDGSLLVSGSENGEIKLWSLPTGRILGCAMDLAAMPDTSEGITYEAANLSGQIVTYTLPCGSPLPAGAVCTCNCVSGGVCSCVGYTACSCDGDSGCSCVGHVTGGGSHYWYPN